MPSQHSLQHILSDAKSQPTSSTTVLLSTYITHDITAIFHFLYALLQPLLDGSHNILSSVKHWGLIAKNLAQRVQPVAELIPIIPGLLLNEFLIDSTFLSGYFFTVLMAQLMAFCVLAALLKPTDQQRLQLPNKFMPMIFSLCLRNLNLAISKSVQLSNTDFCDIYTALSAAETCDSSNTIMTRFLGVPMTCLSSILLLQLANRISLSVSAWHKKQFIALQPSSVTLSSTKLFEMTTTVSTAFLLSMQKSILLQVQGGVVLYQYLSPSREGLSQYTSLFTFLLTLMPSLITEAQTILTNNERCREYNLTNFNVIENQETVVQKSLYDIRYGDVIKLTSDASGKLITLAAHIQHLIDADREVVIVSDKTGTITTSQIECHGIIPVNATQAIANNVVLATYQGLSREIEAEEHALLEKIKETNTVSIESLSDTQRVFKKKLNNEFITTWQLGFIREITASVTLVKQEESYLLIFATGKLPDNIHTEYSATFKNHCEKRSRIDIERQHARFRRDWAYTLSGLPKNNPTIQLIKNICELHKAGTRIPISALEKITPQLKEKLQKSILIAIADNTNALKTNASEFLNHPNRHLLTGNNARACVSFANILFPNKTIIIFDSPTQQSKNADFLDINSISIETLTPEYLFIISKFSENDGALLSRILEGNMYARPYLMFSDCTPESKALIAQRLYKRKNKPFIVGFGDGANDAKQIATRERDYTQLIAVHSLSANALACFMYAFATLCNMDSRAAIFYSLMVVPLYWKYHAQLLVRYSNQTHTFFNHQHPTENMGKRLEAVVN